MKSGKGSNKFNRRALETLVKNLAQYTGPKMASNFQLAKLE